MVGPRSRVLLTLSLTGIPGYWNDIPCENTYVKDRNEEKDILHGIMLRSFICEPEKKRRHQKNWY